MAAAYQPRYRPPTVYFEPSSVPPSPPPGALLVQVQPVAVPSSAVPPPAPYVYDEFNEFRSAVPGTGTPLQWVGASVVFGSSIIMAVRDPH